MNSQKKVLVCITPQGNSRRLIDYGNQISTKIQGELHILHVVRGRHIFLNDHSAELLQKLFEYGSARGATVHALCGDNVTETVKKFVKGNRISHLVLGSQQDDAPPDTENIYQKITSTLPHLEVYLLDREA